MARLTVVGCSGSVPGPDSPASCYLVEAPDPGMPGRTYRLLLDLGNGALGALQRHVDVRDLDAVLLSHLHPDHCLDLCGLYVALKHGPGSRPGRRLPVLGPAGVARRMARAYEVEPGTGEELGELFAFGELADRVSMRLGPFMVTPYRMRHPVEAYGFRVGTPGADQGGAAGDSEEDATGAVLAYTGDTDDCAALASLAAGASLLLSDAAFEDGVDRDEGVHLSAARAARAALDAGGVRRLMLTHIPPWKDPEAARAQAAALWPGEVELAVAGASYDL